MARRFALEGEVEFMSDAEEVLIDVMGAAEMELGGVSLLIDVADMDEASFLEPDERCEGLRCVTKRWSYRAVDRKWECKTHGDSR